MKTNYRFSRSQLIGLCSVILLSPALRLYPAGSANLAGQAAWLSAPAAIPLLLIYIYFICRFMDARQENEGLGELCLRCLGAKVGKAALLVFSAWLLLYGGFVLRSGADRLITTIYPYSAPHVFTIVMGLICLFGALGPVRSIVRVAKLVLPIVLGTLILILLFALFSIHPSNLLPITVYDFAPVVKGTLPIIDVILVVIYTVCFVVGLTPKEKKSFRDYSVWMVLMSMLLMVLSIAVIGNFGAELTTRLTRPFFSLVRNLVFFHTLERVEALVVALWILPDFLLVSLLLISAQHCLCMVLGTKSVLYQGERLFEMKNGRWVIPVCAGISILCGLFIAPDPISLELWSVRLIPLINLAVALLLIPFIYIVGKARKKL